jgi:phospholipid/cholesterol/gamma-HCH transport system substrate-binding protein
VLAVSAVCVAVAAVAVVLLRSGSGDYTVHALFQNASQLVKGDNVQVAGAPIGSVSAIKLTDDGQADITLDITDDRYKPLHVGTQAVIRQASLSGVANRYVDLFLPGGNPQKIPNGGVIGADHTTTAVDLDQLFNTFDPKTRDALRRLIRGYGTAYGGRGAEASAGFLYLNPSLAASSRLFEELNRDSPLLRDFVVNSSQLVTTIASRRDHLASLINNLATTTGAIGRQKAALADAIHVFPSFMRRANSTFVNLRSTLDDLTGLVNDSKPVAKRLRPFVRELRPLALDAQPTLRDLSALIQRAGKNNDLIELTKSSVPVRNIAVGPVQRNGKSRPGALPSSTDALKGSTPEVAYARPYSPDFVGWFDDFSHPGVYDALGGGSRAAAHINLPTNIGALLPEGSLKDALIPLLNGTGAISVNQRNRCPGSIERGTVWKPATNAYWPNGYPCDDKQVPIGK